MCKRNSLISKDSSRFSCLIFKLRVFIFLNNTFDIPGIDFHSQCSWNKLARTLNITLETTHRDSSYNLEYDALWSSNSFSLASIFSLDSSKEEVSYPTTFWKILRSSCYRTRRWFMESNSTRRVSTGLLASAFFLRKDASSMLACLSSSSFFPNKEYRAHNSAQRWTCSCKACNRTMTNN